MIIGQEKPSLEEALEHFGVRGMKWGVRRTTTTNPLPKGTNPKNADGSPRVVRDAPAGGFKNKAEADAFIKNQLNKNGSSKAHKASVGLGVARTAVILGIIGSQLYRAYNVYNGDFSYSPPKPTEMWI